MDERLQVPQLQSDRAAVFVRKDALLYQALVDRALSPVADPRDWHWDENGRGIWVSRDWFSAKA